MNNGQTDEQYTCETLYFTKSRLIRSNSIQTDEQFSNGRTVVKRMNTLKNFLNLCFSMIMLCLSLSGNRSDRLNTIGRILIFVIRPKSEAVIACCNFEYKVMDTSELMRFGESDIKVLAEHQNQVVEDFEVCGKTFTAVVSQIVSSEIWAGNRTGAET
ncbi:hypothetical protein QVD17_19635 [Tagetes erecta]|uniref:Uncharacterized protein n=1 Tax=Tagetes erecta TaxID=13708 RepID=A0AAD8NWM7_TARER|nr:hypothetical protein QVD17_19635 [Tagetes erecta]